MKKCCFISVYFGDIPLFFKPFLDSCRWNESFNWLIVHDKEIPYEIPSNVNEITININEFRQLIFNKVGFEVPPIKPYKICDYRPAFGLIFEDYLKDFAFWGICDTDILIGDLNAFITDEILKEYDKIFTMGHMSLIRNNETCNKLFYLSTPNSRDYTSIFMNPQNCIFDEVLGFTEKFTDNDLKVYKRKVCADVSCDGKRIRVYERWLTRLIQPNNRFLEYSTDKNYTHQVFVLNKGKIYKIFFDRGRLKFHEYSYIHKIEHSYEDKLDISTQLIITEQKYIKNIDFFKRFEEGTITKTELDKFSKKYFFRELKHNAYLFLLWNYRNIRHIIFDI